MGKKEGILKGVGSGSRHRSTTLREQSTGIKIHTTKNVPSLLRCEHLKRLASWAGGEASIPPLAALFGHHLSSAAEETGFPIDTSIFVCQRCETLLQPGYNCTVRIEKNKTRKRIHHKSSHTSTQNNIAYTCHFCSHNNLKKGTPRGHVKEISSKAKNASDLKPIELGKGLIFAEKDGFYAMKPTMNKDSPPVKGSGTSAEKITPILLTAKKRRHGESSSQGNGYGAGSSNKRTGNNVGSATAEAGKGTLGSSRRKRKGWTTLKEIAERASHENATNIANLTIPFLI